MSIECQPAPDALDGGSDDEPPSVGAPATVHAAISMACHAPFPIDEVKMEPSPEAVWRERMRLILLDPDEHCPGSVYLAMALRIRDLERGFGPPRVAQA